MACAFNPFISIISIAFALKQNVNQKKNLEMKKENEIKILIGPFSLSKTFQKKYLKTKTSVASIFVQGVPRNVLTNFWICLKIAIEGKRVNPSYVTILSHFRNACKVVPIFKSKVMDSFYIE